MTNKPYIKSHTVLAFTELVRQSKTWMRILCNAFFLLLFLCLASPSYAQKILILTPHQVGNVDGDNIINNFKDEFELASPNNVTLKRGALNSKYKGALTLADITGYDIVAVVTSYIGADQSAMDILQQGAIQKTSNAFIYFLDTCCHGYIDQYKDENLVKKYAEDLMKPYRDTAFQGSPHQGTIDTHYRGHTISPLNTSSPYANDFKNANINSFYGGAWYALQVPEQFVLFQSGIDNKSTNGPSTPPVTDQSTVPKYKAYGALIPQTITKGACVFLTMDASGFDAVRYPGNSGKIGKGFVAAATSLGGISGSVYPVQTLYNTGVIGTATTSYKLWNDGVGSDTSNIQAHKIINGIETTTPSWSAASKLPTHDARKIFTTDGGLGVAFNTTLSTAYKTTLNAPGGATGNVNNLINYLRGDRSNEGNLMTQYRARKANNLLGPAYSNRMVLDSGTNFGWSSLAKIDTISNYNVYLKEKRERTPIILTSLNDGMLHAFDATIEKNNSGKEVFAYIPKAVRYRLKNISSQTYTSGDAYQLDAPILVQDIFDTQKNKWRTFASGALGVAGNGVFMLDITQATNFSSSDVKFDIDDTDTDFNDPETKIGNMYQSPKITRLQDGTWVAIFGNGFEKSGGKRKAALYVVNALNGEFIQKIVAGDAYTGTNGQTTGLGGVAIVADASNTFAKFVYAGDYRGNMWRFDLSNISPADWSATKVATVTDKNGGYQSILTAPTLVYHPDGGYMVYFGTGKMRALTQEDQDKQQQSLYAIRDLNGYSSVTERGHLAPRSITVGKGKQDGKDIEISLINDATDVNWNTQRGWVLDLQLPNILGTTDKGPSERVLFTPEISMGKIVFTTQTPVVAACDAGVLNRLYALDAFTGKPGFKDPTVETKESTEDNRVQLCTAGNCAGMVIEAGKDPQNISLITGENNNILLDPLNPVPPPNPLKRCPSGQKPVMANGKQISCMSSGVVRWYQLR